MGFKGLEGLLQRLEGFKGLRAMANGRLGRP